MEGACMRQVHNYLVGMDCGTTNIKAIIIGEDGQIVAEASKPSKFLRLGPGMHEQDANEWWRNTVGIFQSLTSQAGPEVVCKIRGISISSHTVTMLPLDKDGNPLRNAITYQDSRSTEEMQYIVDTMGFDHFVKTVGGQPAPAFLPSKILWYKKNEPELFERTKWFVQANSYLNYKLTNVLSQDIDQATRTQCMDIDFMKWSKEIGDIIGINLNDYLPSVYLMDDIIGCISEEVAELTGLISGIPVIAGCSDAIASMHAIGISTLGEAGESSGTSSLVFVGSEHKSAADVPVVTRPCTIKAMPWVYDAPITTTGAAIKWYIDTLGAEECAYAKANDLNIYDYLNELALESKPGSNGLIFYPYLLGERAPIWDDAVRGMYIGLSMATTHADMIRSIFEGTAFAMRHVIETIGESGAKVNSLRICGGGAKSKTWAKIKASMLNVPVFLVDDNCGDVPVGDALIVGHRVGVFPDLSKAIQNIIKISEIIEPDPEWVKVYDQLYPIYRKIFENVHDNMRQVTRVCAEI